MVTAFPPAARYAFTSSEIFRESPENSDRRHLSEEQRREIVAELRQAGHSYRAIGGALGIDEKTARNDFRGSTADQSAVDQPDRVTGLDGKSRPATRPQPTPPPKPDPAPTPDPGIGEFWHEPADEPPLPDRQDEADQGAVQ